MDCYKKKGVNEIFLNSFVDGKNVSGSLFSLSEKYFSLQ